MRIAWLAAAHSSHTARWVNALVGRGYSIDVISQHVPVAEYPIDRRAQVHLLPVRGTPGYFLNRWPVERLLRELKPDLLHAHYAGGYGTLARLSGFHPMLLSVWGSDIFLVPGQGRWKAAIVRRNLAAADWIASTSRVMAREILKHVAPARDITITPFGIDCEQFRPMPEERVDGTFVIGTIKTLEPNYRVDALIEAFALVKQQWADRARCRLLIVGGGPLRGDLQQLACRLGVGSDTTFAGAVAHAQVPRILNSLSIFVALSKSESFGVAVLEASACGIAVVVSDVGGLREVTVEGETGFVVPGGDAEAAARTIGRLIEDENLRTRMGHAGRAFVLKEYEWGDSVARMETLYQDIVSA